jgi:hypothetical protein
VKRLRIKQRSPAAARWAGKEIHQIEKMRHCELSIVGAGAARVKHTRRRVKGQFAAGGLCNQVMADDHFRVAGDRPEMRLSHFSERLENGR